MNFLWISGWAVPPAWLVVQAQTAWPRERHAGVAPSDASQALKTEKYDVLGGYSLGTLWLLRHAHELPRKIPMLLLAPIFAFAAEHACGGRVAQTQLRLQRRHVRSQPAAAIADFFHRAGLTELNDSPETAAWNATRAEPLDEELGWLENWRVATPPENWLGFAGENDPLLDSAQLKKLWPALRVVAHAGHAPGPLMQAAKEFFPGNTR